MDALYSFKHFISPIQQALEMMRDCGGGIFNPMITKLTLLLIVLVGAKQDVVISNFRRLQSCAYATGKLLRLSSSKSIYLVENCTLRIFPDADTFAHFGFDFSNVIVITDGMHCITFQSLDRNRTSQTLNEQH